MTESSQRRLHKRVRIRPGKLAFETVHKRAIFVRHKVYDVRNRIEARVLVVRDNILEELRSRRKS